MTDIEFVRVDPEGTRLELLPLDDAPVYMARYRTAEAVLQAKPGEIQVPSIRREDRGDFKAFMGALVDALECNRVRFVGVRTPDSDDRLGRAWDLITPDDARPIYDAVDGFDFEVIDYELPDGSTEPCHTLVGTWEP